MNIKMKMIPLQFFTFTFIDEVDGTERKVIISTDRIDRIVELKNSNKPKVLEQAKSILFFKKPDNQFPENFRYLKESVDEISR